MVNFYGVIPPSKLESANSTICLSRLLLFLCDRLRWALTPSQVWLNAEIRRTVR
ncbi:hypothetical protein GXM_07742 [Nostoc sphaeroides CCNUC1]|uniref:Uncharacterized protein n=1 Tax=Nostoc sphaeroides CCNUC1 TaxID=2653204 RepID=A0A5P8WBY3_9NOSO|nr:hypothetical protein GXM_07742 [Nostoc sphaeroides CCNUC1]